MVILETAAITAAGYGLYRGGDAAVRKGKDTHKEFVREKVRHSQRSELQQKSKTRQNRVAELLQLRQGPKNTTAAAGASAEEDTVLTSQQRLSLLSSSATIEDRHKNVMEKLRSNRAQEPTASKAGPKLLGMFGKKK
jgi:hypothetical protein